MGEEGPPSWSSPGGFELTKLIQQGSEQLMSAPALPQKSPSNREHIILIPSRREPLIIPALRPDACIYRVPRNLRGVNQEAYTPQLVSIGPIHRDDENLRGMESYKLSYLKKLCDESGKQPSELWREVQLRENAIRIYYEDSFDEVIDSDRFIEMVLFDSAFVIMIIMSKYLERHPQQPSGVLELDVPDHPLPLPPDDYALSKAWRDFGITRDLMLLENQLPYFVLHDLYTFAFGSKSPVPFYDLACDYFRSYAVRPPRDERRLCHCCCLKCVCYLTDERDLDPARVEDEEHFKVVKDEFRREGHIQYRHFTDLIREFWSYKVQPKEYNQYFTSVSNVFTITKLYDAGVKFEMDHEAWPLKMEFRKRLPPRQPILKMPRVSFQDDSECLIRNLMAYEQCHHPYESYISEFFMFLSFLINTAKDVELLAKEGIVTNLLGDSAAVADAVKGLGKNIAEVGNRYHPLYVKLNAHCENRFFKTIAILRRVYFNNLWKATGTLSVTVVLVLTLLQTINSYKQLE